jgi:hypothetical protein
LYDAIETGKVSLDDLAPRIRKLRARQGKLLARRNDLRHTLDEGLLIDRKAFIRSFVKEVTVSQQDVRLSYTLPLLPDGLTEESVGVLPIVRYGGPQCTIGRTFSLSFTLTS